MDLALLHREPPVQSCAPHPVWRTCLREIEFLDHRPVRPHDGSLVVEGAEAYRLLLEIICGLRSPLLGETQVQGQFRSFLATLDPHTYGFLIHTGQRLLSDARTIRESHLRSLGSRSYGAAVRCYVRDCARVAIVGAGSLAADILPYIQEGRVVDQWVRRLGGPAMNAAGRPREYVIDESPAVHHDDPTALLVAAPAPDEVIRRVARRYSALSCVIDLRGEPATPPLLLNVVHITLADVFARAAASIERTDTRVLSARHQIQECVGRWAAREELHPFGWDDLCA